MNGHRKLSLTRNIASDGQLLHNVTALGYLAVMGTSDYSYKPLDVTTAFFSCAT